MKHCPRCGETKPLSEFYTWRVRGPMGESDYATGYCRVCMGALKEQWRQATRERYLAYMREYSRRRRAKQAGSA